MTLGELLRAVSAHEPFSGLLTQAELSIDPIVTGVAYDSRQATAGSVFVALRGQQADGTSYVRDAITRGAIAVFAEVAAPAGIGIAWLQVADARLALAALASEFFGRPSEQLSLVGITGTNGKTTTSYVLASIFEAAGMKCGRIGTVGYRIGQREHEAARTTPEAPALP